MKFSKISRITDIVNEDSDNNTHMKLDQRQQLNEYYFCGIL